MTPAADDARIIESWNATKRDFSADASIHSLFEDRARIEPSAPAVWFDDSSNVSYGDLNERSAVLARFLVGEDIRRGDLVGILMTHCAEMVVAQIGVLKAGAAFLPLDPDWPPERLRRILAQLTVRAVLAKHRTLSLLTKATWSLHPPLKLIVCTDLDNPEAPVEPLDKDAVIELWDSVIASATDEASAAGFNVGSRANSCSPIHVKAYKDLVVEAAASLLPERRRVLEIGAGSGLIARQLAPKCERYVALDPCFYAQLRMKHLEREMPALELVNGFAHEIEVVQGEFDLVILASTVQFFPGLLYLESVIERALCRLAPGGHLFLADVVDARATAPPGLTTIHPQWFEQLSRWPGIENVRIIERTAAADLPADLVGRYEVVITSSGFHVPVTRVPKIATMSHVRAADGQVTLPEVTGDDIAYVIFTSGSTGTPKGVVVQHRALVNLVDWVNRTYAVDAADKLLLVTSFGFDLSVYDIHGILAAGGSVRVATDDELRNPDALLDIIEREGISFWDSAPAFAESLMPFAALRPPADKGRLRRVFLSGDWIPLGLPDELRRQFPDVQVVALGGATEATIWSNHFLIDEIDPSWASIPYGRPMQNARYYVATESLAAAEIGQEGDLFIAGVCLALGYASDAALTAEKFIPDPFSAEAGARMYRSGDRARWKPDGTLEFLGRRDDQIKVRGHRVELGEIQAVLATHPGVSGTAVVAADAPTGKRIIAFVKTLEGTDGDAVASFARASLPTYMIPTRIIELSQFPLSATGKVDRSALQRLAEEATASRRRIETLEADEIYTSNGLREVANAFAEVLRIPVVGRTEDFFELGGHSLLATRIAALLRQSTGIRVTVRDVFENPTPQLLAARVLSRTQPR